MAAKSFTPAELLKRLPPDLIKVHLTFVNPSGIVATFASDNAKHFKAWWLVQAAKSHRSGFWLLLNKREFTSEKDPQTGLPIKRLSSCLFEQGEAAPLPAERTRFAFETDANTGMPLPPMTDIRYVDFA